MVINPANFRFIQPDKFILTVRNPGFDMMLCFFIYQLLVYGNGIHTWIVPFLLWIRRMTCIFSSVSWLLPVLRLLASSSPNNCFHCWESTNSSTCSGVLVSVTVPSFLSPKSLFFHVADNRPDLKPGHIQTGTDITDLLHLVFASSRATSSHSFDSGRAGFLLLLPTALPYPALHFHSIHLTSQYWNVQFCHHGLNTGRCLGMEQNFTHTVLLI